MEKAGKTGRERGMSSGTKTSHLFMSVRNIIFANVKNDVAIYLFIYLISIEVLQNRMKVKQLGSK